MKLLHLNGVGMAWAWAWRVHTVCMASAWHARVRGVGMAWAWRVHDMSIAGGRRAHIHIYIHICIYICICIPIYTRARSSSTCGSGADSPRARRMTSRCCGGLSGQSCSRPHASYTSLPRPSGREVSSMA